MSEEYRTEPQMLVDFLRGRLRGLYLDVPSLEADLLLNKVADLIESLAVQPIPLSERRPGPADLGGLDNDCCWWGYWQDDRWIWIWDYEPVRDETHWLPASTKYLPARVEG